MLFRSCALVAFCIGAAAPAGAQTVAVPAGVLVPVALTQSVSSQSAKAGDPFSFKTTAGVRAGDVVIPSGSMGRGIIAQAKGSNGTTKGGVLQLQPETIELPAGGTVAVAIAPKDSRKASKRSLLHIFPFPLPIGGILFIGAVGNPARNVKMDAGTAFDVVTVAAPTALHTPGSPR
ncbi:MAG TPA: hypothetical protein VIG51_01895 [Candidatus Baltobacteraceae bacterium]|jgi:hypothetical protein